MPGHKAYALTSVAYKHVFLDQVRTCILYITGLIDILIRLQLASEKYTLEHNSTFHMRAKGEAQ